MPSTTDLNSDTGFIVFVRAPLLGRVKTRLTRILRPEVVLELYKCFVQDILESLALVGTPVLIAYHPANARQAIIDWLGPRYVLLPQRGGDLGARMANAFGDAFKRGFQQVILLGSDFPDLPSPILQNAVEGLVRHPAVIGPSFDGGYYLIGFNADRFLPPIFERIPWSTEGVFDATMRIFAQYEYDVYRLAKWRDIDEHQDLLELIRHAINGHTTASHTVAFLHRQGLIPKTQTPESR